MDVILPQNLDAAGREAPVIDLTLDSDIFDSFSEPDVCLANMTWVTPQYTKGRVDWAGQILARGSLEGDEHDEALAIVNNWRSSHSYPLHAMKMTLLARAKRVIHGPLVAQRIKRLSSISSKLKRTQGMQLSRMHDIGGCRAIMPNVSSVDKLVYLYEEGSAKNPHDGPELVRKYDYIVEPKEDGYRSIHL